MRRYRNLAVLLVAAMMAACNRQAPPASPSVPEVTVVVVQPQAVTITSDLPGRVTPHRIAEVRARVDGIVLKREFAEGSDVKAGQRLYLIDPAAYQAAYNSANAALSKAKADLSAKKMQAERTGALIAQRSISKQAYDDASASAKQAQADVEAATAELDAARIRLGYTEVLSPIDGRIGKSKVTEGAYVRAADATLLATVQQLDSVYVDVTQSSADILKLRNDFMQGLLKQSDGTAKVSLRLEDGSIYTEPGSLQFADSTVDESTGTVTLRALFPNEKLYLLPGMFVHAVLESGINEQALLVPQQAVTYDAKGQPTALVVGTNEQVELRVLQVNRSIGNQWLVSGGLKAGERVITEGLQKVHPGSVVKIAAAR